MFKKPLIGTTPDYSENKNWLSLPETLEKIDLIYLYPSSCNDPEANAICDIDNRSIVEGVKWNCAQQASIFENVANIYAPY